MQYSVSWIILSVVYKNKRIGNLKWKKSSLKKKVINSRVKLKFQYVKIKEKHVFCN